MMTSTQGTIRVREVIEILKADICLSIWDEAQNKMLFNGKVYQLYDNKEFDIFYIDKMLITFDKVSLSITY